MAKKFKIKSEKPKEKWRIFNCSDPLIEKEMLLGPHLELFGNREVVVEGCMGIWDYSDSYLKLKLQKGALILCGTSFDIISFENATIRIKGSISSVEFCV